MGYPAHFKRYLEALRRSRERPAPRLDEDDARALVSRWHPERRAANRRRIAFGPNAGEWAPKELALLLSSPSRIDPRHVRTDPPDLRVDVLVLGGGGAGAMAALAAHERGASVALATKLRYGDSNTVMATALSCAIAEDDSPVLHFLDTLQGSGFTNVPELVRAMVEDGPGVVAWLRARGANLRVPEGPTAWDGSQRVVGHSRQRGVQAFGGITGLEITRTLREELLNRKIALLEFHPVIDLLTDEDGRAAGAVLEMTDTRRSCVVRAASTVLATGGMGRLHCAGFSTSNHYGATADGLVVAYRAGARLIHQDSVQFHPTGIAWPPAAEGWLLTEGFRAGLGAALFNARGRRFANEVATRDVVTASILRECAEGRGIPTPEGKCGVWLDIARAARSVDEFTRQRILSVGIDIAREPVLVYPTQHYQNGGVLIGPDGRTSVEGLFAAGEVAGGVHGRNRLGGNSLLDVLVFGRRAGRSAADARREKPSGRVGLSHVARHNERFARRTQTSSPLVYPPYAAADPRQRYGLE